MRYSGFCTGSAVRNGGIFMFSENKSIKRIVSISTSALCLLASLRIAPVSPETANAADIMTAWEITENMQLGWNLGNSLDSYMSSKGVPLESYGLESETCWGNPKTTQAMIDAVKAKGFNTIRVPVTWFQHVDKSNGFKIDDAYLARVKEVVDMCYNSGLYVILNMHHEEGWQNSPTLGEDYDRLKPFVGGVWTQLAETFADYDQRLIFESMNEPRATKTDHEWWGPTQAECDTINKLNADVVEIVRKSDSPYAETRLVMLPSYCASSDTTMMMKNVIPEGDDYVAASVHAYSPYNFTMNAEVKDHSTFTTAYENELKTILDGVRKTFLDKDIPVVIGEFSASNYDNTEARCDWAETYLEVTKAYGIPCVLWDNNVAGNNGGEAHGYLNRTSLTWYEGSETVVDTMLEVLADDSIVWGSERKSPVIEHEDITTGVQLIDKAIEIDAALSPDGNCTPGLNATWKMLEGGDVAIKYTGDQPVIAVVDGSWNNWTEIKPYDDKDGIAYYSAEHIKSAWAGEPSEIEHLFARTNGKTAIEAIAIIGGADVGDPPEDTAKIFKLDLSERSESAQVLSLVFTGKAGSTINGCVGYMGAEWTNIEYSGVIGNDGTFSVQVPLYGEKTADDGRGIPAGITSAEAQIWWCDDENGTLESYNIFGLGGQPEPVYGDSNEDGIVNLADAVLIMQYKANPTKYPISGYGLNNADVYSTGDGVTNLDALEIQKYLLGLVEVLGSKA